VSGRWQAWGDRLAALRSRWPYFLAAALLLQAFLGNASTALWDQDEAAYAGFAREMLRSGDWVVPHFLGADLHRKPPLLFWCIAASFKLFGDSELAARLPTTLAVLATMLCTGLLARAIIGKRAAFFAALVLATSLAVPSLGKVAVTDSLVLLFDTLLALALWRFMETPGWRWSLLFWAALALGLLAKGPPTLILAVGLLLWVGITDPRRRTLIRLHPWLFGPLAFVPFGVWARLAWQRTDGELIRWMWSWYVERRATGGTVFGQFGYPGYHFVVMLLALLPWSAVLPLALSRGREWLSTPRLRLLPGWLIFGWLVWEVMPSKLPAYAVGSYPAAAILIGRELDRLSVLTWRRRALRWGTGLAGLIILAIWAAATFEATQHLQGQITGFVSYGGYAALTGLALAAGFFEGARALALGDGGGAAKSFAVAGLTSTLLTWAGLVPAVEAKRAIGRSVALYVNAMNAPDLPVVYGAEVHVPSIRYYVGKTHTQQELLQTDSDLRARFEPCQPGLYVLRKDELPFTGGAERSVVVDGWYGWGLSEGPQSLSLRVLLVRCRRGPPAMAPPRSPGSRFAPSVRLGGG
jgi:4-amino-4-deoxy-L-arabinose transferase-like glycosyltransferase